MIMNTKKILNIFTPQKIKNYFKELGVSEYKSQIEHAFVSFGQEGEDVIINRLLGSKQNGFYVDVGAHHPKRFSNTYSFYQKGWKGINIDAMPNSMLAFNKERPRDINLEIGVSKKEEELTYYMFNEPALNTFSKKEAIKKQSLPRYKVIEEKRILTYPLKSILDKHLKKKIHIDFMSIDVEGLDLDVLESNDWNKYRPSILLVEDLGDLSITKIEENSLVFKFLKEKNYNFFAKTFNTLFFKDGQS